MKASAALAARLSTAAAIAVSGYIHADLYLNGGYRHIHIIGTAFLLQAGGAFAVTLLLLVSDSAIVRLGAAAVALGTLGGFTLSRTIGIFGFTERGFTPSPQAAISVIVEVAALLLLAAWQLAVRKPAKGLTGAE
ncbi:hypothetical protein [Streptosporangium sp. NPDC001681]|uniref:hypothetical protein n=1 Tax=Streptosporangium sp. NPDC001681 TaxID=3154395 RepID=UPI003319D7DB